MNLQSLGLTKGESQVYLALLKTGLSSAGPLVKEAKISRSKIYEITDRLIAKGLVSSIVENGIKKFKAVDPRTIPDYLEKQKQAIDQQKQDFQKLLPTLLAQVSERQTEQSVEVFEGWTGIKNVFNHLIKDAKRDDIWYAFGIPETFSKERARFFQHWRKETDKIGIIQKLIANTKVKGSPELAPHSKFSKIRYIDEETATGIEIFKDYTLLGIWTEKPILIVVKGKAVAESFLTYFNHLWERAQTT